MVRGRNGGRIHHQATKVKRLAIDYREKTEEKHNIGIFPTDLPSGNLEFPFPEDEHSEK